MEYSKTLSIALLTWQAAFNDLPGCCFAEESCEALLSRMASRCVSHRQLTSFRDVFDLFVSMPPPGPVAPATTGWVKQSLVSTMVTRVRRFLRNPMSMLFPSLSNAREGVWLAAPPNNYQMPDPITAASATRSFTTVMLPALRLLTARAVLRPDVQQAVTTTVPQRRGETALAILKEAQHKVQQRVNKRAREGSQQPRGRVRRRASPAAPPVASQATQPTVSRQQPDSDSDYSIDFVGRPGPPTGSQSDSSIYDCRQWDESDYHSFADTPSPPSSPVTSQPSRSRWSPSRDSWAE